MLSAITYGMVYLGAALMVVNIFCFIRFTRFIKARQIEEENNRILYIPTTLLILFLAGYLAVGLFGDPDLIIGGILFGGSIFVFVMYRLMDSITQRVIRSEHHEAELMAAEESNKVKSSFLASISHEMRTPMNVIIGLDRIALRNPELSSETRDQLERIGHSAQHLMGLINNILSMNQIETGKLAARSEAFSLREIWEQLNAMVRTLCEGKGLTFQTSLDDSVARWYSGDSTLIKQALLSILDNAVKYTEAPGIVTFSIGPASAEGASTDEGSMVICFNVTDTGVGISPEFIDKVFDVFGQEDTSSTNRYGGSGLGLASAKSMVELMGGDISVSSEKGKGSTFIVSLPLAFADSEEASGRYLDEESGEQASRGESSDRACEGETSFPVEQGDPDAPEDAENLDEVSLAGKVILVVDDVEDNAEIVIDLLDLEDAMGERAENGQDALEKFKRSPEFYYDAILMDLRMPVLDGLGATQEIRALDRPDATSIPIIAISANVFESDIQKSLKAGMNMHLPKPVDPDQLYGALKRFIRERELGGTEGTLD